MLPARELFYVPDYLAATEELAHRCFGAPYTALSEVGQERLREIAFTTIPNYALWEQAYLNVLTASSQ